MMTLYFTLYPFTHLHYHICTYVHFVIHVYTPICDPNTPQKHPTYALNTPLHITIRMVGTGECHDQTRTPALSLAQKRGLVEQPRAPMTEEVLFSAAKYVY